MLSSKPFKCAMAILATAAFGTVATSAMASPPSGVTTTTFVRADFNEKSQFNSDRIKLQTKDATDVLVQQVTFAPGSSSGWHHHPGIIIVTVASGLVTVWESDCSSKVYGPGSENGAVFVEGGDEAINVTSSGGATNYPTLIVPDGVATRIEDEVPVCAASTTFRKVPTK